MTRADLVARAGEDIARGSKSFRLASTLFARATRERAWLLYAWCRACDDLADGQEMGHEMRAVVDATARLVMIRENTAAALEGRGTGLSAFDGLSFVARESGIAPALMDDHVEGFALDTIGWQPRSEADLLRYCYHVAGVVGVMMALVMGVAPEDRATLDRACDLGLAFQLANIARDVREDARAGRCYLPSEWLQELELHPNDLAQPGRDEQIAILAARLAGLAAAHEARARVGAAALPFRSRWAVLAAAGIYGGIAREVAQRGAHAWDERVTTSRAAKLGWVVRAGAQATWMAIRHPSA